MKKKLINGLLFGALAGMSQVGSAAVTGPTTINFSPGMNDSFYSGFANIAPGEDGICAGNACFYEDGMAVGIVKDTSNDDAHIHRVGSAGNRKMGYHSDSSGIYIRAQDSSAFSLTSLNLSALASDENPDANGVYESEDEDGNPIEVEGVAGPNDFWEILGYSSALNDGLDVAADSGAWVAKKTVTNGYNGVLEFNDDVAWLNISAIWIHYHGYQQTPADSKQFGMSLDNVVVDAAVVPVPAAVWLFGTGLMGLLSAAGRKKRG